MQCLRQRLPSSRLHTYLSRRSIRILGIESTCDESGIALLDNDQIVWSKIASQWDLIREHGGVVPILAAREHELNLPLLFASMLKQLGVQRNRDLGLDAVAIASGPGLGPCLNAGLEFAKGICEAFSVPMVAVNHLEAHLMINHLLKKDLQFPYLGLILSGGHTQAVIVKGLGQYDLLGTTLDDAIGEAYDKVARLLGIEPENGCSAGYALEQAAAASQQPNRFEFPVAMLRRHDSNFSFSGLKAAVRREIEQLPQTLSKDDVADIACAFQRSVVAQLRSRLRRALKSRPDFGLTSIALGGGVACNAAIQDCIKAIADEHNLQFVCPPSSFCGDNGVSIAYTGKMKFELGHRDPITIGYSQRWPLCHHTASSPTTTI